LSGHSAIALKDAWAAITPTMISNCFKKAGIVKAEIPDTDPTIREDEDDDEEDLIPLSTLVTRLRAQGNAIAIEDLESMLDTAPTCHIPAQAEVIASIAPSAPATPDSDVDDDDDVVVPP